MEDKAGLRKMVEANLRSVTQSRKGGVPLDQLERDYRDLLGTPIPYKNMGYNNLVGMIHSMPDVLRVINNMGQNVVIGVADEATLHISKMVSRQKEAKVRKPMNTKRGVFRMQPSRGQAGGKAQPQPRRYPIQQKFPRAAPSYPAARQHPRRSFQASYDQGMSQAQNLHTSPTRRVNNQTNRTSYETPPRFQRRQAGDNLVQERRSPPQRFEPTEENRAYTKVSPEKRDANCSNFLEYSKTSVPKKIPSPKPVKECDRIPHQSTPVLPPQNLPPKEFIAQYAGLNNLPYNYTTMSMGQNKKMFGCKLMLAGIKYSSYPTDASTAAIAEEISASKAKEEILSKAQQVVYDESPIDTIVALNQLMTRIKEIIADMPHGVWSNFFPEIYEKEHKQKLPENWLSLVNLHVSDVIKIDKVAQREGCILSYTRSPSGTGTPTSTSSRMSNPLEEEISSELCQNTWSPHLYEVPDLVLPDSELWEVIVTSVSSTTNISVRILDHADDFMKFFSNMIQFYNVHANSVSFVHPNDLCAIREADANYWHRVRVEMHYPDTNKVSCYFVDIGETSDVEITDLYELAPAFEKFAFQAVNLRLSGLEDNSDLIKDDDLTSLLGKTYIAQIVSRDRNGISAVLFDTSGEVDININESLKEEAFRDAFDLEMPQVNSTIMCHVTYVSSEGDIFFRISSANLLLLENEIEKLTAKFENAAGTLKGLSIEKMYIVKYIDGLWYRARLMTTSEVNSNEAEVFYVDYGNTSIVPLANVCDLEPISRTLARLPFQAVHCVLDEVPQSHNLLWTEETTKALYELVPDEIILKVDHVATDVSPARVSLYKRNEDSMIISINQTLAFKKEVFREENASGTIAPFTKPTNMPLQTDSGFLSRFIPDVAVPAAEIEVQMAKRLSSEIHPSECLWTPTPDAVNDASGVSTECESVTLPEIPDVGQEFDVFIPWVANPWNFVVQPLKTCTELNHLQDQMKKFYSCEENICELPLCLLQVDEIYAVNHMDKMWYRARLKQIIQEDPVLATVHFIDYGDFTTVEMTNLQTLYSQFKSLPCQAIKASLSGVAPYSEDWEIEHCLAFRQMIQEKSMASVVMKKHFNDETDFGFSTIELKLIDVSNSNHDVLIHEILIKEKMAIKP